jgi:vanillate O-demethylase ferredoxin subunit
MDATELVISAPRNHFPLQEDATHHVLIGARIGITPLLGMAQHLQRAGKSFELHYFSRSIRDTAFHDVLSQPQSAGKVNFHYAVADRLGELLRHLLWQRPDGHPLGMCGPRRFMEVIEEVSAGIWPPEAVHLEYFSADPAASAGPCNPFEVRL